jgi:hypothetical protein
MEKILDRLPEIKTTNHSLIEKSRALAQGIIDEATFKDAGAFVLEIDRRLKWWTDTIAPAVDAAYNAHKEMVKVKKEVALPLEMAKSEVAQSMSRFDAEQKRKAREQEERIRQEMKKQQEDNLINVAAGLEKTGDKEMADAVLATPIVDVAPRIETPKVDGISFQTRYSAEVFDMAALIKAVAEGRAPQIALEANTVFLNRQAVALKSEFKCPGVRVLESKIPVTRSR